MLKYVGNNSSRPGEDTLAISQYETKYHNTRIALVFIEAAIGALCVLSTMQSSRCGTYAAPSAYDTS